LKRVIVESPYRGDGSAWPKGLRSLGALVDRWQNIRYARAAVRDCLLRGEAPIASHLLLTQPGILRDHIPEERDMGIEAGLAWGPAAHVSAVYLDRGIRPGMRKGIDRARGEARPVEFRSLPEWSRKGGDGKRSEGGG
jgi:hypothetical protein